MALGDPHTTGQGSGRPNIVVILADDMGYSDIGCFGSEIRTPNLDAMASRGAVFTQMYNCARCCPTRASLLTGLYPHQAGVGHMVSNLGDRAYQGYLRDDCATIAEALRAGGYRTLMSGKWHVGGHYQPNKPEDWRIGGPEHPTPIQRGFDEHFGTVAGGGSYYKTPTLARNDKLIPPQEGFYYTDAISDEACGMIRRAVTDGMPFFCYVAYTAPHWPLHAPPEDIAHYEGKYRGGWDALRTARHEQLKSLGRLESRWPISARDAQAPPWTDLPAARRDWEDLRMAVYAAQVDRMDQGIGRIRNTLRELGVEDNTLVMFLSDNGGCAEFLAEDSGDRGFPSRYQIPTVDGRPIRIGNIPGLRPGPADTFMSYDLPWANASNTPFRLYKHWVHEGGISTPLLVDWPRGIARPTVCHSPAHVIDILPTCLAAAGVPCLESRGDMPVQRPEGESFLPAIDGQPWNRQREIFWEHEGNRAVRQGSWKLASKHPGEWELYDMNADRTELNDLAGGNPAKARELAGLYDLWAQRCGVIPWQRLKSR
ncbi:MAG TPA: arylsulfatase [Phycisphaerales bacterium]|nr:arylsulfatase [Phycisphaerales bacterium]